MTGSLTIKNGKYYAVLNIYEDGKRKKKWINSGLPEKGNKRKAEAFLREKIAEYERMKGLVKTDILFADYVRHWLTHIARKVDEVTMQGYQTLADSHILPYFDQKKVPLRNLDHTMIQRYMDEKHECGRLDGKGGLSPRSLRLHKNIISQTLDLAVQTKLIPANPCQFVELPQNVRYESTFYTAAQLQDLFTALQGDELLPLVKITALYGLRRSELLGLQWDSIDFERKTMTIRHTCLQGDGGSRQGQDQERQQPANLPPHRRSRGHLPASQGAGAAEPGSLWPGVSGKRLCLQVGRRPPLLPGLHQPPIQPAAEKARTSPHPLPRAAAPVCQAHDKNF